MYIEIDDNYLVTNDGERNIILQRSNSKGNYQTVGYFSTVEDAFQAYARKRMVESEATSVEELLKELKDLREYIQSILEVSVDD